LSHQHIDYSIIAFFTFSAYFIIASLCVLTTHVTVCLCHAGIKGYLL